MFINNRNMNYQLVLIGALVHLTFFYSIFDIYFTSPLVHGMTPQMVAYKPPAKRLVLMVADGLRVDSLFSLRKNNEISAPFLRQVMEEEGAWGVSHTRVPTESRPGHVALIAGFYEDVSAVAKGWKENPVEFDSVFNESKFTWAWGSPDILPMFAKGASGNHVFTHMYPAESEDFAGADLYKLDTWVFHAVQDFLKEGTTNKTLNEMLMQDKNILFLHLLGIDTNGHAHKPHSREYMENIAIVDEGIKNIVQEIESFYGDESTAYIVSSDHGMTDWGSHGAGDATETLTPLIAWGAGIRKPVKLEQPREVDHVEQSWGTEGLLRADVEQADICPLMSLLIGVPFPLNSVGTLPLNYLSNTDEYKTIALYTNAKQILAQFDVKMQQKKDTTIGMFFTPFRPLTPVLRHSVIEKIENSIELKEYDIAVEHVQKLIKTALEGLLYYHNYDRLFLGVSIILGFMGWMAYVTFLIFKKHTLLCLASGPEKFQEHTFSNSFWRSEKGIRIIFLCVAILIITMLYVQSLPFTHYVYTLLPVWFWHKVVQQRQCFVHVWWYVKDHGYLMNSVCSLILGVSALEIIILSFFLRKLLSLGLIALSVWPWLEHAVREKKKLYGIGWSISCLTLAVFPMLPPVGRETNYTFVYLAGLSAVAIGIVCVLKTHCKNDRVLIAQLLIVLISTYLVWSTTSSISRKLGLPKVNQLSAWLMVVSSVITPLFTSTFMYQRLLSVTAALLPVYLLLSTSHEGLFVLGLCTLLFFWIQLEYFSSSHKKFDKLIELDFSRSLGILESHRKLQLSDLRIAYFFILFLMTAFYGTGNIASVNSFDPSTVYCFLTVFNPFLMGALLLLKILIPFILVSCAFNAIHLVLNVPTQSLFLLVLLMSDFMALHFFLLVRDSGSWLDIGTSISHYVVVMCLCCFLLLLLALSYYFTNFKVNYRKFEKKQAP